MSRVGTRAAPGMPCQCRHNHQVGTMGVLLAPKLSEAIGLLVRRVHLHRLGQSRDCNPDGDEGIGMVPSKSSSRSLAAR
jgi:hypothetical protein